MNRLEALKKAVDLAGGQSALAVKIGRRQQHVWNWLNRTKQVASDSAIPVERAVGGKVTRNELRPDLYPVEVA